MYAVYIAYAGVSEFTKQHAHPQQRPHTFIQDSLLSLLVLVPLTSPHCIILRSINSEATKTLDGLKYDVVDLTSS